jgi:ParB family transcriptional regulator, chromosome partitioning protein
MTTTIQQIPLSNLVPSTVNVRRTGKKERVSELAASIKAHGLLQNLTVRPVGKGTKHAGRFEVIAGGRRLAALQALAKDKAISADANIPCNVIEDGIAAEISLAENALQCPMHPADQYEAFAALHEKHGQSAEDIAARFGVTPLVVRQRLKLGAVSPKLIKAYRNDEMNLEQLMAFTITDDHAQQERVWKELLPYRRDRETILAALAGDQVAADDRRAVFVGAEAYQAAGGVITHDLFDEKGGFFADPELLNRLVTEKLQAAADALKAEGWKWIEAAMAFPHEVTARMRRVYPKDANLTNAQRKRSKKVQQELRKIRESEDDWTPEMEAQDQRLEAEYDALERAGYSPRDKAKAGVIVALSHNGGLRIECGLVRPEDEPKTKAKKKTAAEGRAEGPTLSAKLVTELTAYRTKGLRNSLGAHSAMALTALVHTLALHTFHDEVGAEVSCLDIRPDSASLHREAEGIDESPAAVAIRERHEAWAKQLPEAPDDLWSFVAALDLARQVELLAHCTSLTAYAVQSPNGSPFERDAVRLCTLTGLDMATAWQPTAANYFSRVSKEAILEAVREAAGEDAAKRIASLKKSAMATEAEKLVAGKGWLPPILRPAAG